MKRLLAVLTVFYCLGIILVSLIWVNVWLIFGLWLAVFIATCFSLRKQYQFLILVFLLATLLGGYSVKNSYILDACNISKFVQYKDRNVYNLSGFVDSLPEVTQTGTVFIFRAQELQSHNLKWRCCGKVLVNLDFPQAINYGDKLILIGNLSRPAGFGNNRHTYREYLMRQGIYLTMHIKSSLQIILQERNMGVKLIGFSFWLRERMEKIISRYLPDLPSGILSAMVLGQRRGVPWLVNNAFVKSGTVHILVVSGFNVGIIAFIINLLLKIMRIPRDVRIILAVICLLIYCMVTGATNPVVRATVMGIIFLLARIFKRQPDMYNSLACAVLFILIINPRQLFDIGFQLSFASVLAIVYFYPKLKTFLRIRNYRNKVLRFIAEGLAVSLSAWLGTMGIIAYNFRIISPVTVLANMLIVPLATLITLSGFTLVLSGVFFPALAHFSSITISMLITLLLNINAIAIKIPFAYFYL
ncbi:MAG: ComEC/Rec2 family competence protein [Candidatus Omnitrophota bacterium]|nr:ComEC/Rec2 family competence protein [Candidatus Omnitrophota bacterium]